MEWTQDSRVLSAVEEETAEEQRAHFREMRDRMVDTLLLNGEISSKYSRNELIPVCEFIIMKGKVSHTRIQGVFWKTLQPTEYVSSVWDDLFHNFHRDYTSACTTCVEGRIEARFWEPLPADPNILIQQHLSAIMMIKLFGVTNSPSPKNDFIEPTPIQNALLLTKQRRDVLSQIRHKSAFPPPKSKYQPLVTSDLQKMQGLQDEKESTSLNLNDLSSALSTIDSDPFAKRKALRTRDSSSTSYRPLEYEDTKFKVSVRDYGRGDTETFEVRSTDTIRSLMEKLAVRFHMNIKDQILMCDGVQLNPSNTFSQSSVNQYSSIFLLTANFGAY